MSNHFVFRKNYTPPKCPPQKLQKFWLLSFFLVCASIFWALLPLPSWAASVNAPIASISQATTIRRQAPNISFLNAAGKRVNLQNFRGKIVLLNIWASWCGHCVKELGSLAELQKTMSTQNAPFQLIALNIDSDNAGLELLKQKKLPIPFLHDVSSESLRAFDSSWVPTTVLIDQTGAVVQVFYGETDWAHDPQLKTLLGSLLQEAGWEGKI